MPQYGNRWSLVELRTEIADAIRDPSYSRWSDDQIDAAIRTAIRAARGGRWREEREDASQTYVSTQYRYPLPPACESVEEVFVEGFRHNSRQLIVPTMWHIESGTLVFDKESTQHSGRTLHIIYYVFASNLLNIKSTCSMDEGVPTMQDTSGTNFVNEGVRAGDEIFLSGIDLSYYVSRVLSDDTLIMDREAEATLVGNEYYLAYWTDLPFSYISNYAKAHLYEVASMNRPGVEIDETITMSTYFRNIAYDELNRMRRAYRTRRRY